MLFEDKKILWRASALFLGMCMPTLLIGKTVMGIFLLLGVITGLLATKDESLRATVKLLLNNSITLMLVGFLVVCTFGMLLGSNPSHAFNNLVQLVAIALGIAALFIVLREMPGQQLEQLLKVLAISTVVMGLMATLDALTANRQLGALLHDDEFKRLSNYRLNFVSSLLAVLLPLVWARLLLKAREGEPFAVRIALPAAAFGFFVMMLAGGRAGWVGGLAGMAVFLLLAGRYHNLAPKRRHWAMGFGVFLAAMAAYAFAVGPEMMINRVSIIGEADVGRGMLSGRFEVWAATLAQIQALSPIQLLYGVGVMNYRLLPGSIDMHPHNFVLQLILETGVVGFGLFIAMMGWIAFNFWRFSRSNVYGVAGLAALTAFLVSSLANTSIFRWDWLALMAFVCLLGYRAGWSRPDQKQRRKALKTKI